MKLGTLLSIVTAPIWLPAIVALEAVDTVVFGDRTTLGNDLHAGLSNLSADLDGIERPFPED